MRRGTHTVIAKALTSKLMSRQEKLLSDWAVTDEGRKALSNGRVSYDELPGTLIAALQRIKDQETLWSDVERYLGDLAMKSRYGSQKITAKVTDMEDAIAHAYKKLADGVPSLRRHRAFQDAMHDMIQSAIKADEIANGEFLLEYQRSAG